MSEKNNIITRKKTFNTSKGGLYPTHSTQENLNFRVYTPTHLAQRIFDIVDVQSGYVFDPCIGFGALTAPFKKHYIHGCDIDAHGKDYCDNFFHGSFMNMTKDDFPLTPDLVVMNPPFNGMKPL